MYTLSNYVVVQIMPCIFIILFKIIQHLKCLNMNVSNHITKIKAENTPKFDLHNVKMDDCGIPNYKGVTISSYSLYTLILKCYPHWKVLQIIYSDGTSKALILSKLLTLTAFIKVILTTMRLFNLQIGQNKINDSQYTPKSKLE